MKILSIVGARPQFIKLAPLSKELRKKHTEIIVHTGQHYDYNMSGKLFEDLNIPQPDLNLEIGSSSHGEQTAAMLMEVEKVLLKEKPDAVIVFGDTNSTLAAALGAAKLSIPIVHIEAGLRSFNRGMPEEINRILTDHCSDYLFAPTKTAVNNLKDEKLSDYTYLTGDIMVDTLHRASSVADEKSNILNKLSLIPESFLLLTLHRPYNVDNQKALNIIVKGLSKIDDQIVFPVHPRTKKNFDNFDINVPANIIFTEPQGYIDFIQLQKNAKKIITDSGGIQKEAYILKKPCITLRSETEWVETVENGWNNLVDIYSNNIAEEICEFNPVVNPPNVFGENVAANMAKIINEI